MIKNRKIKKKKFIQTNIWINKKIILTIQSIKKIINVELWVGNHPFFTNQKKEMDITGNIKKFSVKNKLM
jgi:large subunit ribosomal protein L31